MAGAREGKHRAALAEALNNYEVWAVQLKEATRTLEEAQTAKADLSSSEAPLPALKKSIANAAALVEAAKVRLGEVQAQEAEPLARLKQAVTNASRELSLHQHKERARRVARNVETLRSLGFKQAALNMQHVYDLERLAPCFKNITRLDAIAEQSRDQYGHPTDRARCLLESFGRLDAEFSKTPPIE